MNLILLGAPGSGKGTQASLISKEYGISPISTGDIIRENIKNKTQLGLLAEKLINNGQLVPDKLVIDLVKNRLNQKDVKKGFILDGFPRTQSQALALKEITDIDYVILIDVEYEVIKNRILSRRVCPTCKTVYSTTNYFLNQCEHCGDNLITRSDDNEETVKNRYEVYIKQTQPLIDYYKQQQKLYTVEVKENSTIEEVFEKVKLILER